MTTSDGAAVAGQDYIAVSRTLTITAGVAQATFIVPIRHNRQAEEMETIWLGLSDVNQAVVGKVDAAVLTIIGDPQRWLYLPFVQR